MRLLYFFLIYLAVPIALTSLAWKGRLERVYLRRWRERFGFVEPPSKPIKVWLHAVSVGEVVAAKPLIEMLISHFGEGSVWVSSTTPTGSAQVLSFFGSRVHHSYLPYDTWFSVARFLNRVKPQRLVIMETELWPHLFRQSKKRVIPLLIANARLSPRSVRGYSRVKSFVRSVLSDVSVIAAQSEADAARFVEIGARTAENTGNIKFDLTIDNALLESGKQLAAQFGARPVWIAASTHEGEDDIALDAHKQVLKKIPDAALILVPRHPKRFDQVAHLIEKQAFNYCRRSSYVPDQQTQVYLGDSMGEMFAFLAAADVAFVAGSLREIGGHNVLEPAALGKPVIFGPHMHNFLASRELLLSADAAFEIDRDDTQNSDAFYAQELAKRVINLFENPELASQMGARAAEVLKKNRGALAKVFQQITDL